MKVGIDVRPAVEEPAGIGKLTRNLVRYLLPLDPGIEYYLFSHLPLPPGMNGSNSHAIIHLVGQAGLPRVLWHARTAFDSRFRYRLDCMISVGSLQVASLTDQHVILIIPDLSHVLFPQFHTNRSKLAGGLLMRRALKRARKIVAISMHTRSDIIGYMAGAFNPDKVVVAPIGCDEVYQYPPSKARMADVRTRYALARYILFVGTIEPRKNILTLLHAFERVAATNSNIQLVLAGRLGWGYNDILSVSEKSRFCRQIKFIGFVPDDDMPALYRMASVFVYPSLYEGFGIPVLEAMTCGTPVITSNVSSMPEVVGEAGILLDPNNEKELAAAITRVVSDSSLAQHLSDAGLERSRTFSWKGFASTILDVMRE